MFSSEKPLQFRGIETDRPAAEQVGHIQRLGHRALGLDL
jgi:hypothetical protein